jgi:hypothetical protein
MALGMGKAEPIWLHTRIAAADLAGAGIRAVGGIAWVVCLARSCTKTTVLNKHHHLFLRSRVKGWRGAARDE